MVSAPTIMSGITTITFGIYLFTEKGEFGAALGVILSITGLMFTTFGIV
jgi:hypothetical protein